MKIEEFKAGEKKACYQYECFVPSFVNHDWSWDSQELTISLERAVKGLLKGRDSWRVVREGEVE